MLFQYPCLAFYLFYTQSLHFHGTMFCKYFMYVRKSTINMPKNLFETFLKWMCCILIACQLLALMKIQSIINSLCSWACLFQLSKCSYEGSQMILLLQLEWWVSWVPMLFCFPFLANLAHFPTPLSHLTPAHAHLPDKSHQILNAIIKSYI